MSSELRAALLYLGGFQLIVVGRIAKVPGLLYLGIVNTILLILFMLFFGGAKTLFKKEKSKDDYKKDSYNKPRNIFKRRSRYMFSHVFYSGLFYILTVSFLLRQFIPHVQWGIFISVLGILFIFMSFISVFYFEKIYFIRKLMVPIDYVMGFSIMIFGLISFLLRNGTPFLQYGVASIVSLLFVVIVARFGKLLYKNSVFKFIFTKIYVIIFVVSLCAFGFREWSVVSGGLSSSWKQKISFVQQDISSLIEEFGYGKVDFGSDILDDEIKKNNLTGNLISTGKNQDLTGAKDFTGSKSDISLPEKSKTKTGDTKKTSNPDFFEDKTKQTGENLTGIEEKPKIVKNKYEGKLENFVSWRDLLHHLFQTGDLKSSNVSFSYISKTDKDYKYFATAHRLHMIGGKIKPDAKVACKVYMVVLGLKNSRNVNITNKNDVFTPYRNKAQNLGLIKGCKRGDFVKFKNL